MRICCVLCMAVGLWAMAVGWWASRPRAGHSSQVRVCDSLRTAGHRSTAQTCTHRAAKPGCGTRSGLPGSHALASPAHAPCAPGPPPSVPCSGRSAGWMRRRASLSACRGREQTCLAGRACMPAAQGRTCMPAALCRLRDGVAVCVCGPLKHRTPLRLAVWCSLPCSLMHSDLPALAGLPTSPRTSAARWTTSCEDTLLAL